MSNVFLYLKRVQEYLSNGFKCIGEVFMEAEIG